MSEIKRRVNDKLRLRAALTGGEDDLFVRASLYDQLGSPLIPPQVLLPHLAQGTYGENTLLMPNFEQIFIRTEVFLDSMFTQPAPRYRDLGLDVYSLEIMDPTQMIPKAFNVYAEIKRKDITVAIEQSADINIVAGAKSIEVSVPDNEINTSITNNNSIEGTIND